MSEPRPLVHETAPSPAIPSGALPGAGTILFGLLYDLVEHGLPAGPAQPGVTSAGQHAAHLIVMVGMALLLAAIVRDGFRSSGRDRPEGNASHAVR